MMQRRTDRNTLVARFRYRYWNGAAWEFDCGDATLSRPRTRGHAPFCRHTKGAAGTCGRLQTKPKGEVPRRLDPELPCALEPVARLLVHGRLNAWPPRNEIRGNSTTSAFRGLQSTDDRHAWHSRGKEKERGKRNARDEKLIAMPRPSPIQVPTKLHHTPAASRQYSVRYRRWTVVHR